ncbi:MAG TPA: BON domain-containing protein [Azonexus sp.]
MLKSRSSLAALCLVALVAACGGSPSKESTGEYIDDSVITTKVKSAFVQDKLVDAHEVKVDTFKGNVQLSGFVDSQSEIERAAQIAGKVPGVRSVRNDLRLKPR